eukprot:scaffold80839_cov45-Phaeocystis_antarctica.AAC.2
MPIGRARDPSAVMNGTDIWNAAKRGSMVKVPPWQSKRPIVSCASSRRAWRKVPLAQRPSSAPVPFRACPAAAPQLGSSAFSGRARRSALPGRGQPSERLATASGARAKRLLQSRRFRGL